MLPRVRCFAEEGEAVRQKAADCGMSIGQFMLAAALGRQTRSKVDTQIVNELRRLGGLQKHLFKEGDGDHADEYARILNEIYRYIAHLGR